MKKKLLFAAYSLDVGGIETALVTLINKLVKSYDITLAIEKKQGIFLNEVSESVKIIEYTPSNCKIKFMAKIKNAIKRLRFTMKYKNKFDCAISYATYSLPSSFMARNASKNSILWVHNDYMSICNNNEEEYIKFFKSINADAFKKIVFVSNNIRSSFENILGKEYKNKRVTIYNLIDFESIVRKSQEQVNDIEISDETTFLFVGRLTEMDKKVSRLIESCKLLKDNGYKFRALIVGDGKDGESYKNMVKNLKLDNEVIFLGKKKNPYPYFKLSDCLVLTSEHEGFAIVNVEAIALNLPVITTCIADSTELIENKYGYVTEKNEYAIYECMKNFIDNGYDIKHKFDTEKYNNEALCKLKELIEGEK